MMLAIVLDSYAAICEESAAINANVSFRRTFSNIFYDVLLRVTGKSRIYSSMAVVVSDHKQARGPPRAARDVVFQGRIIPFVLEAVLTARLEKASATLDKLTPARLKELFPGAAISEQEAIQTLQFLIAGPERRSIPG
ncbi:hypothetical protein P43SY_010585 [Pythium insidiosum]|uniref:Uncharacterized protein n=1 Tax=Pythium insidiosum TaxID=114742 RepID=A0AAD5Q023_PYTIN|nr:hypothetical protein P43SY_010585 [Pythium insidiosum]